MSDTTTVKLKCLELAKEICGQNFENIPNKAKELFEWATNETEKPDKHNKLAKLVGTNQQLDYSTTKVLTFEQGCQYMGYAKSYVYKMTSAGVLPFSKPNGKSIFFDREKLEAWMLSNGNNALSEKQIEAATYVKTKKAKFNKTA